MAEKPKDQQQPPKESATFGLRDALLNKMQGGASTPPERPAAKPQAVPSTSGGSTMTSRVTNQAAGVPALGQMSLWERIKRYEVLKAHDLVSFTDEMAMLLEVGIPMVRALRLISKRNSSATMRDVAAHLEADVQRGLPLHQAMAEYPFIFSHYYLKSVQAGEESGRMVTSLKILASYLDREERLVSRIRSAAMYPAITGFLALLLAGFLFVYVIPAFAKVYMEYNLELPLPTLIVYRISLAIQNFWWLFLGVIGGGIGLLVFQVRYNMIEDLWSRILLMMPGTRQVIQQLTVYRFAKAMSMLLKSGLPLLTSVRLASEILPLKKYRDGLHRVAQDVENGMTLSQSLAEKRIFPDLVADMIAVGEEVGTLERVFDRLAANMEGDVDVLFQTISDIIEPIMTVLVGGMVLVIALALFLPYFSMGSLFSLQ